jgi:hypothetical protein
MVGDGEGVGVGFGGSSGSAVGAGVGDGGGVGVTVRLGVLVGVGWAKFCSIVGSATIVKTIPKTTNTADATNISDLFHIAFLVIEN